MQLVTDSLVVREGDWDLVSKYSSWIKLLRITAYVLRFVNNIKCARDNRTLNELTSSELNSAEELLIRQVQGKGFAAEIVKLTAGHQLPRSSKLLTLAAFLDSDRILRVGGRLHYARLSENRKHPILLPATGSLNQLILRHYHLKYLHLGPQSLLTLVREKFWPINGKSACKKVVRRCIICKRHSPKIITPFMASLPKDRVTPTRPFNICGVDFCGPIWLKVGLRKFAKMKSYVAVFVCFSTKALHLELVSDLSAEAFLAALKRFFSHRGVCSKIYSDNATNFVGARRELRKFIDPTIRQNCNERGIKLCFIPISAPHFGGIWESSVKLVKTHLHKVLEGVILNLEEVYKLLSEIEACINSRAISPLSESPLDPHPLTPAHLVTGGDSVIPIGPETPKRMSVLKRWQLVQEMYRGFWNRWSREYLSELQRRHKWKRKKKDNQAVGTQVAVKEDGLLPMHWKVGRITKLHPGLDGIVRVVSVRFANGTETNSPVVKLCPLLGEEGEEEEADDRTEE